jgi:hypothetical protein
LPSEDAEKDGERAENPRQTSREIVEILPHEADGVAASKLLTSTAEALFQRLRRKCKCMAKNQDAAQSATMNGWDDFDNLTWKARKLRDKFKDVTGFPRKIFHELCHAVPAAFFELPLTKVSVVPQGDLAGRCEYEDGHDEKVQQNNELIQKHAVVTAAARTGVMKALVGAKMSLLDVRCSVDSDQDEYLHDDNQMQKYSQQLLVSNHDQWTKDKNDEAWKILSIPYVWQAIMKLAPELKEKGELSGDRVKEVLAQCKQESESNKS